MTNKRPPITDNDIRALDLLIESMNLKAELRKVLSDRRSGKAAARITEINSRLKKIQNAHEAWAKGEDVLVAMLSYVDQEDGDADFAIQRYDVSFSNAFIAIDKALKHFNKH